jgi:DNA primase
MTSRSAEDYRQLARDCHKIAAFSTRNNRTALLEMAREWDRLADQHEDATNLGKKDQIA